MQDPVRAAVRRVPVVIAFAATLGAPAAVPAATTVPDGTELGLVASRYRYEEPGLMELRGNKGGLRVAHARTDEAGRHGRLEFLASYGQLDYASNGTGTHSGEPDTYYEVRALAGFDLRATRGIALLPFAGLGYRYLYNDGRGTTSTGHRGYRRESNYLYLPVGVSARWERLLGTVEFDFLLKGRQTSYLADADVGFADVNNEQKRGWGAKANLLVETGRFAFGPWFSYWRIATSEPSSPAPGWVGYEPKNRTTEAGFELRYRY